MDIVLHLGAHRTASTCFQYYLQENALALRMQGVEVWGPRHTRDGMLTGVLPVSGSVKTAADQLRRARGRIGLARHRARESGIRQLVISDENMIGAPRANLRNRKIYAGIGERMARFSDALGGEVKRIALSVRAQDTYWSSVIAFAVGRGHKVPDQDELDRLVTSNRHWRDVIRDLSCAVPSAELIILPYEQYGSSPELKLKQLTELDNPPLTHAREWINRSPSLGQLRQVLKDRGQDPAQLPAGEGRWQPFNQAQTMALRECYADDLFWLRAGADGMATLIEETGNSETGKTLRPPQTIRGQDNGTEERRLA